MRHEPAIPPAPLHPRRRRWPVIALLVVAALFVSTATAAGGVTRQGDELLRETDATGDGGGWSADLPRRQETLGTLTPFVPDPAELEETPPVEGPVGEWSPTEFGCQRDCIVEALVHFHPRFPSFELHLETTVATTAMLWVADEEPGWVDGVPIMNGFPHDLNPTASHHWVGAVDELQFGETYFLALLVTDEQDNVMVASTHISFPERVDDLTAEGSPCYFGCIRQGLVFPGASYESVDLVVDTDGAVDVEVRVSPQAPTIVDGDPVVAADQPFVITQDSQDDIRGTVSELEPDTIYHVVVTATDAAGFIEHATGSFRSEEAPPDTVVDISVVWIDVTHDGDPGVLGGDGEIDLAWGLRDETIWRTDNRGVVFDRTAEGERTHVPPGELATVSVPHDGSVPDVGIAASEWDRPCPISAFPHFTLHAFPDSSTHTTDHVCDGTHYITHVVLSPSFDEIEATQPCGIFGVADERATWQCLAIAGIGYSPHWVDFTAVVAFDVR